MLSEALIAAKSSTTRHSAASVVEESANFREVRIVESLTWYQMLSCADCALLLFLGIWVPKRLGNECGIVVAKTRIVRSTKDILAMDGGEQDDAYIYT